MTYQRREEIFSKETITIEELAEVADISKASAYNLYHRIIGKSDRLGIKGKIHIADYFNYFNIPFDERYTRRNEQ